MVLVFNTMFYKIKGKTFRIFLQKNWEWISPLPVFPLFLTYRKDILHLNIEAIHVWITLLWCGG